MQTRRQLMSKDDGANSTQLFELLLQYVIKCESFDHTESCSLQVPRYIITIHQLLAHTPHDHVERKSLEFALSKLEEISQVKTIFERIR